MAIEAMTQIDLVRVDDGQDGEVSQEQIAQITQDATTSATQAAQTYVDAQDFATETYADGAANTAQTNAINTAAADATEKADEAAKTATNFLEKDENGDVILMDRTKSTGAKAVVRESSFDIDDENNNTIASFGESVTIGSRSDGSEIGMHSFVLGDASEASGSYAYAEGCCTKAIGEHSHVEGYDTTAEGNYSHVEGAGCTANGGYCHVEGGENVAEGWSCHVEGGQCYGDGTASHVEGFRSTATGDYSHAQNHSTVAFGESQTTLGRFNLVDEDNMYACIIGNGTQDGARSNGLTVDWEGNVDIAGEYKINGVPISGGGGGSIKLLWTNPSPNSAFAAQTISVPATANYNFFFVELKYDTKSTASHATAFAVKETKTRAAILSSDNTKNVGRDYTFNGDGTVKISTGYNASTSPSTSVAIPTRIYGVKF